MVQEKGTRQSSLVNILKETAEGLEKNTVGFRWHVVERTPGYNTGGYYDQDVPPRDEIVSPHFNTQGEAEEWMDRHEPDKGKSLYVARQRLIKREWTEWVNY